MDTRKALLPKTTLVFKNIDQGLMKYTIQKEIARGGSSIVYDASYINNANQKKIVRIKECYPYQLKITRNKDQSLQVQEYDLALFAEYKQKMYDAFVKGNDLFQIKTMSNTLVNTIDLYEANETMYIVSVYSEGIDLKQAKISSLKECIKICKQVAKVLQRMHKQGYLYLDIKPENVFLLYGSSDQIQLFDFDSLIHLSDLHIETKLYYSKGYAPLEQELGNVQALGKYSDVYGIGALLYYLIFKKSVSAFDGDSDASYDFSLSEYGNCLYQDKLYQLLTSFFHQSLAHSYFDRYQNMEQVIEVLSKIEQYADTISPYIISTPIKKPYYFIGRNQELEVIQHLLNVYHQVIVYGIGGIGKTSFLLKYMTESNYDACLYLIDQEDKMLLFNDDQKVMINQIEKDPQESKKQYFKRKLKICHKLMQRQKVLIVIDEFKGEIDEDLKEILNLPCDIIFSTRYKYEMNIVSYELKAFQNISDQNKLFQYHLERKMNEEELSLFNQIANKILGHTLLLELIAKQMKYSGLKIKQANDLIDEYGFMKMDDEKIPYHKDQLFKMDTIYRIINQLFKQATLSYMQTYILKVLAYMKDVKIHIDKLCSYLALNKKEEINQLVHEGWIYLDGFDLSIHPIIQECVINWQEDHRLYQDVDIFLKRYLNHSEINISKNLVIYCPKCLTYYDALLYQTMDQLSADEEKFILKYSKNYLEPLRYDDHAMKLYDKVMYIYLARNEVEYVERFLKQLKQIENKLKDDHSKAIYHEIFSTYYDYILDGKYDHAYYEVSEIQHQLINSINASIKACRNTNDMKLLIEFLLSKLTIIIRSNDLNHQEINQLFEEIETLLQQNFDLKQLKDYHIALAFYLTFIDYDEEEIIDCLNKAYRYALSCHLADLEFIDYVLIPISNVYLEMVEDELSEKYLLEAIAICDKHLDIEVYQRKKIELQGYIQEIYDMNM